MRLLCAILTAAILIGGQTRSRADLVDGVTAIVHDSIITLQEVEEMTMDVARDLQTKYRGQPETFQKKVYEAQKENLDRLVEQQLILHDFEATYANFPQSIIDQQFEEYTHRHYSDRVTLIKTLQQRGLTPEKFRKQFRDRFILEQMWAQKVSGEILISPHKIEMYYIGHTNDFKVEDQVKLRMIVLNTAGNDLAETRKLAEEILRKINEGASFAEMASVYSQGSQRKEGGNWDWVERSVLRKELADVAFTLKPGEKSGIIETPEAFYLMLVEDKRTEHVKPLGDVRDEIEKILQAEEQKRLRDQWLARLKKKTFVRYFE